MNANDFKQQLKHYNVILKKVRGHPLHQVMVDGLHESYHPSRKQAKTHVIGAGFFQGLKKGLHTAVKIGKNVAPLVGLVTGQPQMASTAHTYLSAADEALGGKMSLQALKKRLKTAVKIGKVVAPIAGLLTGNPALGMAAATGLNAADTALGGRMSGGGHGRQMSGGNLSGGANVSGGKMVKGSAAAREHMARLRAMRKK